MVLVYAPGSRFPVRTVRRESIAILRRSQPLARSRCLLSSGSIAQELASPCGERPPVYGGCGSWLPRAGVKVLGGFEFRGWDHADLAVEAKLVKPINPFQGRELDAAPGAVVADELCLVEPVELSARALSYCRRVTRPSSRRQLRRAVRRNGSADGAHHGRRGE